MKRINLLLLVLLLFVLGTAVLDGRGGYGRGNQGAVWRLYDPSTVSNIEGKILSVQAISSRWGRIAGQKGIHIELKTSTETVTVHLGPQWYITSKVSLSNGDAIAIVGSRVVYNGKALIIAKRIIKGSIVVDLRDEGGMPLWAKQRGGKRRNNR